MALKDSILMKIIHLLSVTDEIIWNDPILRHCGILLAALSFAESDRTGGDASLRFEPSTTPKRSDDYRSCILIIVLRSCCT